MIMEASVDPQPWGPDWMPITPQGVLFACRNSVARAMQRQPALLLDRFDLHKTHGRPPYRFADRLGVGGIILVALDVGLHV